MARKFINYQNQIIPVIGGSKGGKGGGGGASEDPNSLFSTDIVFITAGLGEGPVYRINPNGPQDIEIQEESVAGTEDISAQASAQQDRGAQWAAFSANESSATDSSSNDTESEAEKVNVQDLLNQMKIESGKISS